MDSVASARRLRVLFLVSAHGGLSQAAQAALTDLGHAVTVCVVRSAADMLAAVRAHRPDLIACPMLTTMIPEAIWSKHRCLIVHPGPIRDRGPSSIDWAIELGVADWGVTVLEANGELDAGRVWATRNFARRSLTKSSLYRHEVRTAAIDALVEATTRIARGDGPPRDIDESRALGQTRPLLRQEIRRIDWSTDPTDVVLRKIHAGDSRPGVLDRIDGRSFHLFGAQRESTLRGIPGASIAQRAGAICRATIDGAVWISHLKQRNTPECRHLKLPAVTALALAGIRVSAPPGQFREIRYEEDAGVGYLHFDFHNGAMSTAQCRRLRAAYRYARSRSTRMIVLMGGRDFFCTGIHLNVIEAAHDPAGESWRNLNAINDVVHDVVTTDSHYVVAAVCGDTAAGGVAFALAADRVVARRDIVINPYYQHMGGLYGSEYWTYLLPRRLGDRAATELTGEPFAPLSARHATRIGLLDDAFGATADGFVAGVRNQARELAHSGRLDALLEIKRRQRARDERAKPLRRYRAEELTRCRQSFFGPDDRYHHARHRFTYKLDAASQTRRTVA